MFDLVSQSFSNIDIAILFFQKLALATLIGILIGIEREHRRPDGVELIAGVRSFTISCISGMLSSYLALTINIGILLISLALFGIISILYIYIKNITLKQTGITGAIALYCTFLLGIFITYELYLLAIGSAVILTFLLVEKAPLHSFATNLTDNEILSSVRFLAIVFILYPITPDLLYFEIINPRWVLLIVIMISTISFVSFLIMKKMGQTRGISISGLLGGLVNSEATTAAICQMTKKKPQLVESGYKGIVFANSTMLVRNLFIAFIVDPSGNVLLYMTVPMLIIILSSVSDVIRFKNQNNVTETIKLESPFAISSAVKFAFGFAILSVFSKTANMWAGVAGVYATALGGFISSAVVTASTTALAVNGYIPYTTAALTSVFACIISTGNKIILVKFSGHPELFKMIKKTFTNFVIFGTIVLVIWGIFLNII